MRKCKFCGLPVLSGNVVHSDCAEAAIEAAALANEERQELEAYRATGATPEVVNCFKYALAGKMMAEITEFEGVSIERLKELAKADKEERLVELIVSPSLQPCGENCVYILDEGEITEDWVTDATIGRDSAGTLNTIYATFDGALFDKGTIGVSVFLSEEEAKEIEKGDKENE